MIFMNEEKPLGLQHGQVVLFNGYGHSRQPWAVCDNNTDSVMRDLVCLEEPKLHRQSYIRKSKFGIGFYLPENSDLEALQLSSVVSAEIVQERVQIARHEQEKQMELARIKREEEVKRELKAKEWAKNNVPKWAKACIVALEKQDESDIMTDYFHHSTKRRVLLAFSKTDRNSFDEMRTAAKRSGFEPVQYMIEGKQYEHRENYSGGSGYYLGESKYSGWIIKKSDLSVIDQLADNPDNIKLPVAASGSSQEEAGEPVASGKYFHAKYNAKTGNTFYMAVPQERLGSDEFTSELDRAKEMGGFYLKFGKGFAFKNESDRNRFAGDESNDAGNMVQANEEAFFDNFCQTNNM